MKEPVTSIASTIRLAQSAPGVKRTDIFSGTLVAKACRAMDRLTARIAFSGAVKGHWNFQVAAAPGHFATNLSQRLQC